MKTWHVNTVKKFGEDVHELLEQVDVCFSAHDCVPTQRTIPLTDHVYPPVSVASSSGDPLIALPDRVNPPVSVASSSGDRTPADLHDCAEPEVSVHPVCQTCLQWSQMA